MPTEAQLEADLKLLSGKTNAVRTYSTLGTLGLVPKLADRHDLNVTVGTWIDQRLGRNQQEIANAVRLAREHKNVVRVLVGNEVVLSAVPQAGPEALIDALMAFEPGTVLQREQPDRQQRRAPIRTAR